MVEMYFIKIKNKDEIIDYKHPETNLKVVYSSEFDSQLTPSRTVYAMKEEDYYVVKMPDDYEYRIMKDWCDVTLPNNLPESDIIYFIPYGGRAISGILSAPETPSDEPVALYDEYSTYVFKSQPEDPDIILKDTFKLFKKSGNNTFPIEVDDYVLLSKDNDELLTVVATNGDNVTVIETNENTLATQKVYKKSKLHPFLKTNSLDYEIGDIVILKGLASNISVFIASNEIINKIEKRKVLMVLRNTDPNSSCFDKQKLIKYKTGEIVDAITNELVDESVLNSRTKPIINETDESYETVVIARHFNISHDQVKPKEIKILHTLKMVLDNEDAVKDKEWALILGPSGSGKTTIAVEYAESKNLQYVIQGGSAQLTVDDLLGYNSITTGEYFPSLLRNAIETGKIFILDEIDACNPNTLLCLNAFKRDVVQFPDKLVTVHPDFRFIATANTLSYSEEYNGRSAIDRATLKRFALLYYDMTAIDVAIRYGLESTKLFISKLSKNRSYPSEYELLNDCILVPTGDYDPRDIQRLVTYQKHNITKG